MLHIPPLIPYSTSDNILISVKRYDFTFVFFKAAYHAEPDTVRQWVESSSYILRDVTWKLSNTSGDNVNHDILLNVYLKKESTCV